MAGLNAVIESGMCDDSGVIYAADDETIMIDLDGMDLGDLDLGDLVRGVISLSPDDLDEQTKRELLVNGPFAKSPDPKCRWCRGTGKVRLLVSESDCDCVTRA